MTGDDHAERGRRLVVVLAAVGAAAAVGVALITWVGRQEPPPSALPAVESHRLDEDQAACLGFGLVMRRSDALQVTLGLGRYQGLDPDVLPPLADEVSDLDDLPAAHPGADLRLIRAFDIVADNGAAVLEYDDQFEYRTAVTNRSGATASAGERCLEIADFDVRTLTVREAGRS